MPAVTVPDITVLPRVAEPDPAMAAFHTARHTRFRQTVAALNASVNLASAGGGAGC